MIETARRHAKPNRRPASGSSRLRGSGLGSPTSGAGPPPPFPVTRRVGNPGRSFLLPPAHRAPPKSRTDDDEPDRLAAIGHPERRPARDDPRDGLPRPGHRSGPRRRGATPEHSTAAARSPAPSCRAFGFVPRPPGPARRRSSSDGGPGDASVSTSTRNRATNRATAAARRIPGLRSRASSGCSRILEEPGEVPCSPVHDPGSERDFAPGLRAGTSHRRGRSPPNSAGSTPQRA